MKTENKQNKKVSNKHISVINTDNNNQNDQANIKAKSVDISDIYQQEHGDKILLEQFDQDIDINYQSSVNPDNIDNINDFSDRVVSDENATSDADAKLNRNSDDTRLLLDRLLSFIKTVDFNQKLKDYEKNEEKLIQYNNSKGIRLEYICLIIVHELLQVANKYDMDIAIDNQAPNNIYMFNGKYWQILASNYIPKFLEDASVKMGYERLKAEAPLFEDLIATIFYRRVNKNACLHFNKYQETVKYYNMNNYTIKIDEFGYKIVKHNKHDKLTTCISDDYNADAKAPEFEKFLEDVLPDLSCRQRLLESLACGLIPISKQPKKATILFGDGSNGKSIIQESMAHIYHDFMLQLTCSDLMCQYNSAQLEGKYINYGDELNYNNISEDRMKALVTSGRVRVSHKHKKPFMLTGGYAFVFNANEFPRTKKLTHAFARRWSLIHFDKIIPDEQQDIGLIDKLKAERAVIVNLLLEAVERFIKNGYKFTESPKSKKLWEEFVRQSDVVSLFLSEEDYIHDDIEHQPVKNLYKLLCEFCDEWNYPKVDKRHMQTRLKALKYRMEISTGNLLHVWIKQQTS